MYMGDNMSNTKFIEILKEINKRVLKDVEPIETITFINQKIIEIENELDPADEYIDKLIGNLK